MQKLSLETQNLEKLLQTNWTKFLNPQQTLKTVLEDVRKSEFRTVPTDTPPPSQVKLSVTKFQLIPQDTHYAITFWTEFTVPTDKGVAVGSFVYIIEPPGTLCLKESYGTLFVNQELNDFHSMN